MRRYHSSYKSLLIIYSRLHRHNLISITNTVLVIIANSHHCQWHLYDHWHHDNVIIITWLMSHQQLEQQPDSSATVWLLQLYVGSLIHSQDCSQTNTGVRLLLLACSALASRLCSRFFMWMLMTRYFDLTWSIYSSSSRFRIDRKLSSSGKLNASHYNHTLCYTKHNIKQKNTNAMTSASSKKW